MKHRRRKPAYLGSRRHPRHTKGYTVESRLRWRRRLAEVVKLQLKETD